MLTYDYTKRISAKQALEDEWIKTYTKKTTVEARISNQALTNLGKFTSQQKLQSAAWT